MKNSVQSMFFLPVVVAVAVCLFVFFKFGWVLLITVALLIVLEITLSFDNAVVNAKVLEKMSHRWQQRFLTWGILIAVFFTRALLPILIVAASTLDSPWNIARIAFTDPVRYSALLSNASYAIGAFGALFLILAGLRYFIDDKKEIHWLSTIEKQLAAWGKVRGLSLSIAIVVLAVLTIAIPAHRLPIFLAGVAGIVLFVLVQWFAHHFSETTTERIVSSGLALFIYLNILDAAFSLDSVVGAFALSKELVIIVLGLGVGAYFVRTLTLFMVRRGTLKELVYLEHGAHYAILGLAAAMMVNLFIHIPDPLTGGIGLLFVGTAYISSLRFSRHQQGV